MFDASQLPQHGPAPPRCLAEVDGPPSERWHDTIEPTAHCLFAFQHIHRAKYQFEFVELPGNGSNHSAHFAQPLLVQRLPLFGSSLHWVLGNQVMDRGGSCSRLYNRRLLVTPGKFSTNWFKFDPPPGFPRAY